MVLEKVYGDAVTGAIRPAAHIEMLGGCGIGDWLMCTPAIAAYKRENPDAKIIVHSHLQSKDVFLHNPDVFDTRYSYGQDLRKQEAGRIFSMAPAFGREGTIRIAFDILGVRDRSDRRLRFPILPEERRYAIERARACHLSDERPIIAVQEHGSWKTKRWGSLQPFLRALVDDLGFQVVLFGGHWPMWGQGQYGPGILDLRGKTSIRLAVSLIGLSDAYVGFDSGLTLSAIALGTPTIGLVGTNDPKWLLGDAHAANVALIRKRTPADCKREYGKNCREGGYFGDHCPLRADKEETFGAQCMDEILPSDVLAELEMMPRRASPFEKRIFSGCPT